MNGKEKVEGLGSLGRLQVECLGQVVGAVEKRVRSSTKEKMTGFCWHLHILESFRTLENQGKLGFHQANRVAMP
jgi:hypothetical protein